MKNWLRPASLGFLDGAVTTLAMLAFSAGVSPANALWFGIAGWLAGSLSMGVNEYASVSDQNRAEGTNYSPMMAAWSSFTAFSVGCWPTFVPLMLGLAPWVALVLGLVLVFIVGSLLARFTKRHPIVAGLRMLTFAAIAVMITLLVSQALGVQV